MAGGLNCQILGGDLREFDGSLRPIIHPPKVGNDINAQIIRLRKVTHQKLGQRAFAAAYFQDAFGLRPAANVLGQTFQIDKNAAI
ncbi:MAG: hypothetical protein KUG69_13885 [Marinosulfonomonas sp.]|nr:hypothetical protein [Marinosulfonomonas sp.]